MSENETTTPLRQLRAAVDVSGALVASTDDSMGLYGLREACIKAVEEAGIGTADGAGVGAGWADFDLELDLERFGGPGGQGAAKAAIYEAIAGVLRSEGLPELERGVTVNVRVFEARDDEE